MAGGLRLADRSPTVPGGRAGDWHGYAGVTSRFAANGRSMARAEMALNQDKSRLQLRRRSHSPEQERAFKFTACAVSENLSQSPRAASGRRPSSPVMRGLKVGEIMSALRDRSPVTERPDSMAWPHRRGEDVGYRSRSASPRGARPGPGEEVRMAAMFAAVSTEEEASESQRFLIIFGRFSMILEYFGWFWVENGGGGAGERPSGPWFCGVSRAEGARALSPRVRDSPWLDGLSARTAERGGCGGSGRLRSSLYVYRSSRNPGKLMKRQKKKVRESWFFMIFHLFLEF